MTALARVVPQTFGQCGYLLEGSEHGPICRQTAGVADSQVRSLMPQLPDPQAGQIMWPGLEALSGETFIACSSVRRPSFARTYLYGTVPTRVVV